MANSVSTSNDVARENQQSPVMSCEPPLGEVYLTRMSSEVTQWTEMAANRYASLAKYTASLEDMNRRLEARTDRSLKLAEVINIVYISSQLELRY